MAPYSQNELLREPTLKNALCVSPSGPVLMMLALHLGSASLVEIFATTVQAGVANLNALLEERSKLLLR